MTDELSQLVIRKNTLYMEWKATTDEQEYLIKKEEILELLIIHKFFIRTYQKTPIVQY